MNQLDQLKKMTTIVADTGDIDAIKKHLHRCHNQPFPHPGSRDQTRISIPHRRSCRLTAQKRNTLQRNSPIAFDKLFVNFGCEILKIVPGRVSTEVDARLSFDVEGTIEKARKLISLYEAAGIDRKRILIKLASTWEGTLAAYPSEKEGIHCNMTLLFSLAQAIACAEAKATLISPFVGRILDWYKKNEKPAGYPPEEDPGVISVSQIYNYFKNSDYKTQIMGASFRNTDEILELAGCDLLTIAPTLLEELQSPRRQFPASSTG